MYSPVEYRLPDQLSRYASSIDFESISRIREERLKECDLAYWTDVRHFVDSIDSTYLDLSVEIRDGWVNLGDSSSLLPDQKEGFERIARSLIPWRKGPFRLFGLEIDGEWRSDYKWDRLESFFTELKGKRVADVGCNNGYYMLRMLEADPELVVGLDPAVRCYFQFELIQRYLKDPRLQFELMGAEELCLFPEFFDSVVCLGVVYHNRNPLGVLKNIFTALRPGGVALVETMAIPGAGPMAFSPPDRYSRMRNVYFIPTAEGIVAWMMKSGFTDVEIVSSVVSGIDEQRATEFAPFESFEKALDCRDSSKTIEGHPAPLRVAVTAKRPG